MLVMHALPPLVTAKNNNLLALEPILGIPIISINIRGLGKGAYIASVQIPLFSSLISEGNLNRELSLAEAAACKAENTTSIPESNCKGIG